MILISISFFFFLKVRNAARRNLNQESSPKPKQEDEIQTILTELSFGAVGAQLEGIKEKILKKLKNKTERAKLFETCDRSAGQSIMHLCVQHCPDLVPVLLKKRGNFDLNKKDIYGVSSLCVAALVGNEGIFTKLLNAGCKPDKKTLQYFCAHFCSENCGQLLKTMIKMGANVNADIGVDNTPLHTAVSNKREDLATGFNFCS